MAREVRSEHMKQSTTIAAVLGVFLVCPALMFAQQPQPPAPAGQTQPAQPGRAAGQGRGGGQGVGGQGDPDPGVHFVIIVDNPQVRVLQVTLQPGAVRRPHVHNDVTFHMMVPVTGAIELTLEGQTINAVQGQAYYMVKGQQHGFANKTAAAVQVIELFVKPPADGAAATPAPPAK
jgi:quercetin dioxygenase-like cupin family protein